MLARFFIPISSKIMRQAHFRLTRRTLRVVILPQVYHREKRSSEAALLGIFELATEPLERT
jgi:hypothetical protein